MLDPVPCEVSWRKIVRANRSDTSTSARMLVLVSGSKALNFYHRKSRYDLET